MKPTLIAHGGAGDWPDKLDHPKSKALYTAAQIGREILEAGGAALDAVEKAVNFLEDSPLFDAGTGSHLNRNGVVEMDALIADGSAYNFGAVAGVQNVQHPISLARKVMEMTNHCFIIGAGTNELAAISGIPLIANIDLVTPEELEQYRNRQRNGTMDTVGAVAIDRHGNVAAATSTGGTPEKFPGRVGDSPIFGAGGYADNRTGASSATGYGENIMRVLLTKYACDQIERGKTAQEAAAASMHYIDQYFDPSMAGIIIVDHNGNLGTAHTTPKFAIGWIDPQNNIHTSMKGGLR